MRSAIVYEVNVRTFSPAGTFDGVTARLDELRALGVDVLWLMPVHPVGRERAKGTLGSPYAVRDFYAVNPAYGTVGDLRRLVAEAHARGLKVVLDLVANHTAWDSELMRRPGFYRRRDGAIVAPIPEWSDVAELDYGNPALRDYMVGVMEHWVREVGIDGYRCDVAMLVPTDFWEQARDRLDRLGRDLLLIAEAAEPELLVHAFDADYAWPFHRALAAVLTGRAPATAIREVWERDRAAYPRGALRMRFTDNHDERRAIARFGEAASLAGAALVFTLDGIPMLYNGMEAGDTTESGGAALFERLPVFWAAAEQRPEFPRFFRAIIGLRRAYPVLQQDAVEWLGTSDASRVVAYVRRDASASVPGAGDVLVAINLSSLPWTGVVEVDGHAWREITPEWRLPDGWPPPRPPHLPALALEAWEFRAFTR